MNKQQKLIGDCLTILEYYDEPMREAAKEWRHKFNVARIKGDEIDPTVEDVCRALLLNLIGAWTAQNYAIAADQTGWEAGLVTLDKPESDDN